MINELFCPNPNCPLYRVGGEDNVVKFGSYQTKGEERGRYRCNRCGETFSERAMTGLYGLHADKKKVDKVIKKIKGGDSLRKISREMDIKLDTVRYWRDRFINHNRQKVERRQSKMGLDSASKEVLERAKKEEIKFIQLQFTDILGMMKCVIIPLAKLHDAFEKGVWFDGSSIEGFVRIAESDMILKPDPLTYQVIPWKVEGRKSARLICDIHTPDGKPFEGDPRSILKRALAEAGKLGYEFNTGPEVEFYLLKKENGKITTVPHDIGGYFDYPSRDYASEVREDIIFALEAMGMTSEMSHHEVGPGQHEIDVKYSDALRSADNTITLKYVIKSIASQHDLYASFMPKPLYGEAGSGMHVHQSLFDKKGKNVFYDAKDKYKLSKIAHQYLAGQLSHAKALTAIVAPTVNSYKRLVSGYEAPVYICWGQVNRSALIRIPRYSAGREQSTRMELRCPDPSCNPYLAFAAMLTAGLDGIKKKMEAPAPVEEDVYKLNAAELKAKKIDMLPFSIKRSIEELEKDKVVKDALGSHTFANFFEAKTKEFDDYRMQITPWELDKYLEAL
ncbi:MAG: type I glutamate--ammonia ligase [Candidatus Margulisiibacteriota bacterium]|nr:type I glutamate--ammonia ligase [Candidatus Margulisiibacteriota bacterium]